MNPPRQVRAPSRTPPSGRRPAAQNGRFGLCDLLRPRAHLEICPRIRQSGDHPPRQRPGDLLRTPLGAARSRNGVEARHIIGLGGSTGRSTGPHLHFETRYYGQAFDPERLIDFKNGILCRETFLLKKSFFSIYSNAGQDFEDEIANEEQDKKEAAEKAAMALSQDPLGRYAGAIARKYGTTVTNICRLNGIKSTTILRSVAHCACGKPL